MTQLTLRSTALLLALICLWLSSAATLRHTDDLSAFRAFHAGRATERHSAAAPQADLCAAHQWMDAWQTLTPVRPPVEWSAVVLAVLACPLAAALHLRCFDYASPRGPPTFPA